MLTALVLACSPQVGAIHAEAWLTTLRKVAQVERASLCVDVDESRRPGPVVYEKPDGERGLDRLAVALGRTRSVVEGVHVFSRRMDADDLRRSTAHEHTIAFLKSLGITETNRLVEGRLELSSLPGNLQRRLRFAIATFGNGLGDSMLAQYPDRIGLRLVFDPVAVATARTNEGQVTLLLYPERTQVPLPDATLTRDLEPLGRPLDGTLDFGDGAVLPLNEVMGRAEIAFGKRFSYDSRLGSTRYFLSGTFTEPRFLKAVEAATVQQPIEPLYADVPPDFSADKQKLITNVFGPIAEKKIGVGELTYNDLIHGKITTFQFLFGSRPPRHVQVFMAQYRIEATDEVHVSGELYLAVAAPGLASLDTGERDGLGRPIPYSVPHFIKIAF